MRSLALRTLPYLLALSAATASAQEPGEPQLPASGPASGPAADPASDPDQPEPGPVPQSPGHAATGTDPGAQRPGSVPAPSRPSGGETEAIPVAPDTLGGHLMVSASSALIVPAGRLQSGVSQSDFMAPGAAFGVDAGIGISRLVLVGGWGQLALPSSSSDCPSCSTRIVAGGAFLRYHLVQGIRFDPWMSAGIGVRRTSVSDPLDAAFLGLDWLRLQVGGDWYGFSNLGFGPYLELSLGSNLSASDGNVGGFTVYTHFLAGLRLTFDTPGKPH